MTIGVAGSQLRVHVDGFLRSSKSLGRLVFISELSPEIEQGGSKARLVPIRIAVGKLAVRHDGLLPGRQSVSAASSIQEQ
jgi:hypothetical protein